MTSGQSGTAPKGGASDYDVVWVRSETSTRSWGDDVFLVLGVNSFLGELRFWPTILLSLWIFWISKLFSILMEALFVFLNL